MGLFRPFIKGDQLTLKEYIEHETHPELDKPFTPADALTVSRPILALKAAKMLLAGEKGATPVVAAMAATDMEGRVARFIDKKWPNSGWGCTAHGAPWDTYADTSALLIVGAATLLAPRVSKPAKAAMSMVLAQETSKAHWAFASNQEYMRHVKLNRSLAEMLLSMDLIDEMPVLPGKLELPTSVDGKEAMAEKLTAAVLAVATNDFDNQVVRTGLGVGALTFASIGTIRGERARGDYEPVVHKLISMQSQSIEAAQHTLAAA